MTFDFVDDDCVNASDQYMFGETYLVAPVLSYRAQTRRVYLPRLPATEQWRHHYEPEATYASGAWHTVPTRNLSTFPLFVRRR